MATWVTSCLLPLVIRKKERRKEGVQQVIFPCPPVFETFKDDNEGCFCLITGSTTLMVEEKRIKKSFFLVSDNILLDVSWTVLIRGWSLIFHCHCCFVKCKGYDCN